MEFNKTIKEELEGRIKRLEDFIESKGLGSRKLSKAKKTQRSVNLAVFVGSLVTIVGVAFWALSRDHD
jgi:hypothetical protein